MKKGGGGGGRGVGKKINLSREEETHVTAGSVSV